MKVWTDKQGNKLTGKEFMARWKQGIEKVSALQQAKTNLIGYTLVLAGILWGLVTSFLFKQWWLLIILCGSLIVSATTMLGAIQKYIILDKMEKTLKEVQNVQENNIKDC